VALIRELRRRHVFKAVASYAVIAWLLIQIAVSVETPLGLPGWFDTFVIVALIIGFPVCGVLAWFYDLHGLGFVRTRDRDDTPDLDAEPLGQRDRVIVGLSGGLAVLLVATAAYFLIDRGVPAYTSIGILPFVNVESDATTEYLSRGLRDSLATRLSRFDGLRIMLGPEMDPATFDARAVGASLGVSAICTGRFVQSGDAIELVTEIIDVGDGSLIWREEFTSAASGLIAIESDIARQIPARLGFTPDAAQLELLSRPRTTNAGAYRLYLQGRYFWNRRTHDGFLSSIELYQRAVDLDPNYGLAYAGLADAYLMLLGWGLEPPGDVAPLVEQHARQAIQRDPTLAEPHATLGYLRTIYDRDWDGARAEFLRAIELNGSYASGHHWYAFLLMTEDNMAAAIEEILLARQSEPLSPIINAEVGYFLLFDRQYERALAELQAASRLDPNYQSTINYLIRAYAGLGRTEEALAEVERWRTIVAGDPGPAAFGSLVLPQIGLADETRAIYDELLAASRDTYVMPGILGVLAAAIGDYDAAFGHFDAAVEGGSLVASWLRDPVLDSLRADPRYAALLERIGLEP
jgi:serine/threonine-protein kinase